MVEHAGYGHSPPFIVSLSATTAIRDIGIRSRDKTQPWRRPRRFAGDRQRVDGWLAADLRGPWRSSPDIPLDHTPRQRLVAMPLLAGAAIPGVDGLLRVEPGGPDARMASRDRSAAADTGGMDWSG